MRNIMIHESENFSIVVSGDGGKALVFRNRNEVIVLTGDDARDFAANFAVLASLFTPETDEQIDALLESGWKVYSDYKHSDS